MDESPPSHRGLLGELHLAACFLTRLPLPEAGPVAPGDLAPAMRCFPLVGAGLGLAAGLVHWAASALLPGWPAALLAILALVLLTGALHEDGLADLADGLGARGGKEKRLEIMRDSRTGTFGVLALVFAVGLRASALAALPAGWMAAGALVAAAALSRALMPAAMQVMAPARADGLGHGAGVPDATVAATAGLIAALLCLAGLGLQGALAGVVAGIAGAAAVVWLARRAIGGYTGDVLGALQQTSEAAILLAAVAFP